MVVQADTRISTDTERACELADMLKALAHPLRLRIVALLVERQRRVHELAEALDVQQTIVSQQLRILRMSRLVAVERSGGGAVYRTSEPRLADFIDCMERCGQD
jgi:DNA-binding transcriptional ArsR family regulator